MQCNRKSEVIVVKSIIDYLYKILAFMAKRRKRFRRCGGTVVVYIERGDLEVFRGTGK